MTANVTILGRKKLTKYTMVVEMCFCACKVKI